MARKKTAEYETATGIRWFQIQKIQGRIAGLVVKGGVQGGRGGGELKVQF